MGACALTFVAITITVIIIATTDSQHTPDIPTEKASATTPTTSAMPGQRPLLRLERQVIASSDDLEQHPSGKIDVNSEDLDLGDKPYAYVRFQNVAIPHGAEIESAFIQFTTKANSNQPNASYLIQAELTPNAQEPWLNQTKFISKRQTTTTQVNWENVPTWKQAGDAGDAQQTNDLSILVQEIIDQSGWRSGNAMAFIIANSGAMRKVATFDLNPDWAPRLIIEYREPKHPRW